MNQKKARRERQARRRSQDNNKLQRKHAKVEKSERQAKFDAELGEAVRERDKIVADANKMLREDLKAANDLFAIRKNEAWVEYEKKRNALIKKHAKAEQEVNVGSA